MPRLDRAARRTQLIDAAAAAFLAGGFDGTSMDAVAERAEVTRLIVYRHFDSKASLYAAVLDSVVAPLAAGYRPGMPGGVGPLLMRVGRAHPDAFRLLWRHARHEPTFAKQAESIRAVAAEFADGVIRPHVTDDVMRRWGSAVVVDYLWGGICEWLDSGDPERDDEFAATLQLGARALIATWSQLSDTAPEGAGDTAQT